MAQQVPGPQQTLFGAGPQVFDPYLVCSGVQAAALTGCTAKAPTTADANAPPSNRSIFLRDCWVARMRAMLSRSKSMSVSVLCASVALHVLSTIVTDRVTKDE